MEINFYSTENLALFWDYVKMLLSATAPGVMIWFALVGVGLLLGIVVKAWKQSAKEEENEDIEIKHY
jgi:hypothetical protein